MHQIICMPDFTNVYSPSFKSQVEWERGAVEEEEGAHTLHSLCEMQLPTFTRWQVQGELPSVAEQWLQAREHQDGCLAHLWKVLNIQPRRDSTRVLLKV